MEFQNGILELDDTRMEFPKINARDVILRAQVRKVSGQNVGIGLRLRAPGGGYAAFFNGTDISAGDWFGIGRKFGGTWGDGDASTWKDLAALHIGRKIQPDLFVEMAFAAIGDTLTLYVDGTKVITVKNNEAASGFIAIGARNGRGLYKDVECQILDPVPISLKAREPSPTSTDDAFQSWTPLFNGKDLTGWESLENGSSWKVENGVVEGRAGGFGKPAVLVSKRRDFKNFHLRVKVRYPDVNSYGRIELRCTLTHGGSNGYFVDHGVWPTPIPHARPFGSVAKAIDYHYAGPIHWVVKPEPIPCETDRWYTMKVSLQKNVLTTSVDGKKLSDYIDDDETYKFGAIALVCYGDSGRIQFQDIMIHELPADIDPGKR
jgi:hypothetical protein